MPGAKCDQPTTRQQISDHCSELHGLALSGAGLGREAGSVGLDPIRQIASRPPESASRPKSLPKNGTSSKSEP